MVWRLVSLLMGYLMLTLVFGGAVLFSFTSFMDQELQGTKRLVFIAVLLFYGCYRAYRLYLTHRQIKSHEA